LIIIDSQAVKNTCNASAESKGFCFYKATNGIKRHLAVDSLGKPFFTHCTRANVTDDQAAGMSNLEIGEALTITEGTVKSHINNILSKLNVNDRTQAVITALKRGIVSLP
jgi:hypothetical protein